MNHARTAVALRHVACEGLGHFGSALRARGWTVRTLDVASHRFEMVDEAAEAADLLVVLGGPVAAGDTTRYPVLGRERALLARRLAAGRPTLGVCLGAQLMALALGAEVGPLPQAEIGFAPLQLAPGAASPLDALAGRAVLHWHGDGFTLPAGARSLASTPGCPHQAFALGRHALGLQFHAEFDHRDTERWLLAHAHELAARGIDPAALRREAAHHAHGARDAAHALLHAWVDGWQP